MPTTYKQKYVVVGGQTAQGGVGLPSVYYSTNSQIRICVREATVGSTNYYDNHINFIAVGY